MKKILKVIFIISVILVVVVMIVFFIVRSVIASRFVPDNLLLEAGDRISDTIEIDLSNPLQKQVTGGYVEGIETDTENVQVYKGIPYAAPPVGDLRWKAAADVVSWNGVRECDEFGPNPIQGNNEIKPGEYGAETVPDPSVGYSEDCLYLNVWTNGESSKKMPVVFYIPGGAWVGGSNSVENYNGEYLASQNVVFVSINYRLGILGWLGADVLAEEDAEGSTGNYGLTDIIKALEWVQKNIAVFGGDSNNVTLYGGSAGANLIDLLMISPKTEGLFQKAVSMSYPIDMVSPAWSKEFKTSIGNKLVTNADTLNKLRNKSIKKLMNDFNAISAYAFSGPTIDGVYIDMVYEDALKAGRGKDIDYITGINYNDAYPGYDGEPTGDAAFVRMIENLPENVSDGDVLRALLNSIVSARAEGGAENNTYILQFEHVTPGPDALGAVHGGDLQYMLHYFSSNRSEYWRESDYNVGDIASAYFINFCKTGNPNGTTASGETLATWEASEGDYRYFIIDESCEMRQMDIGSVKEIEKYLKLKKVKNENNAKVHWDCY